MRLFKSNLTIALLLTTLAFGAVSTASAQQTAFTSALGEVNLEVRDAHSPKISSSETFEYASIEENVNRLELELAEAALSGDPPTRACVKRALSAAIACGLTGFMIKAWVGAAIGAGVCGVLGYIAC